MKGVKSILRWLPAVTVFLAVSLGLSLAGPRWETPLYRTLAPAFAWLAEAMSQDVIFVDPDSVKGPVIVFASNDRKIAHRIVATAAESAYPLFGGLLVGGLLVRASRRRTLDRHALWRIPASLIALAGAHLAAAVIITAYAAAFATHGAIPRGLRLLGLLTNTGWSVVPFVIYGAFFVPWGQLSSGSSGMNASQGAPQSGQIQSSGRSS
jgi:hypothetical protein